jgi:cell wall-associated NlpC family hydrolase
MSVSGLSREHVHQAVNMTLQAAVLGYHHREAIHYTQGASRWSGIDGHHKAWRGEYPPWADCSAYVTWCLWNGLDHFHHSDTVNGLHWWGGYTGTLLEHGLRVRTPIPGDAVIYGSGWPGEHVALYTGGGLVVSHGGESGPLLLPMHYRSDVLSVRRYI